MVVLDEAYFEYSRDIEPETYPDGTSFQRDNVLVLRTFSKIYGIAGVRIGYAIGPERLIMAMRKVKFPFEPSTIAQSAGLGALEDTTFLQRSLACNTEGIAYVNKAFKQLGISIPYSVANFYMIPCGSAENAQVLYAQLMQHGVYNPSFGRFWVARLFAD